MRCAVLLLTVCVVVSQFSGRATVATAQVIPGAEQTPQSDAVAPGTTATKSSFVVRTFPGGPRTKSVHEQCESVRRSWHAQWMVGIECPQWDPPCEVVVHRHRSSYLQAVGRGGAATSGSSLVRRTQGQGIVRRIDLMVAATGELSALPHELVHVILADHFVAGFPPLWLDEGLAMFADSAEKQQLHWRDCQQALRFGTALPLRELLRLDRPATPDLFPAVYGQSLTLTHFLAQIGRREKLLEFVHQIQKLGCDDALRAVYGLDGCDELEHQWRQFVRRETPSPQVSLR